MEITRIEFINRARELAPDIARATKNCNPGKTTSFYVSDNGTTIGNIQKGWGTRSYAINFGSKSLTKKQVLARIAHKYKEYLEMGML